MSLAAVAAALCLGGAGCAGGQVEDPDLAETARVERLRLKITKVRNAIDETRGTIARSQGAPYLPELYLRLAELLSEEARYHYQLASERQQSSGGVSNVPQVRLLKNQAIDIYKMIVRRFEGRDEVPQALFNLGSEHRELGNFSKMRGALQELIDDHPDSPLRQDALLIMGDYFFDRSKLRRASKYYRRIVSGPLNHVQGVGYYKLGWVEINIGTCDRAIRYFENAIDAAERWRARAETSEEVGGGDETGSLTSRKQDIDVRREALVDLTYCYSREREVADAIEYFRNLAHSRGTYVAAVAKLAQRYRLNDQYEGAIRASREAVRLGAADRDRLEDARTLYSGLKNRDDYRNVGDDAELIAESYRQFYSHAPVREQERERLREEFENYLRDLATRAQTQLKIVRGDVRPGEGATDTGRPPSRVDDDQLAREVAASYRTYLATFPEAARRPDMTINLSEVLASLEEYYEAGRRALEAAGMKKEGVDQKNALYDAVVHFQEALADRADDEAADGDGFERVSARASLRRAARHLLDYKLPDQRDRRVKFAVAKTYYNEGRYLRAIDQLSAVAYEFPNSEEADAAIQLVLDSYDTLNDYDGLRFASRRYLQKDSPASNDLRVELQEVLKDAQQRKLDQLSLKAAGDEGGDLSPLMQFADEHEGEELGERSLINAFVAARARGNSEKMYTLAETIASDYPESDQLPGIYTTVAKLGRTRFEFEKAIRFMRRAAGVNPDKEVELLTAVGDIYEQMGMAQKAEKQYREAADAASGAQVGKPAGKLAVLVERHRSPREIVQTLEPYADTGDPDVLSRLGLAYVATGKTDRAEQIFKRVLQGGNRASVGAVARARYGIAETLHAAIREFPPPDNIERVQKFISLVEVAQQKYVEAAREGSPVYTAVSLNRLARTLRVAGDRLREMEIPSGLNAAQRSKVEGALESRIQATEKGAKDALESCAGQLWSNKNFTAAVRKCLKEEPLERTLAPFDTIKRGDVAADVSGVKKLRQRVSKNPEDAEALRTLGKKFLDAGHSHVARIVFAQAVKSGGGPTDQNLLGIARLEVQDRVGAFAAFASAAEGGDEAGRQNLATLLERAGFPDASEQVFEQFSKGQPGGRKLSARRTETDRERVRLRGTGRGAAKESTGRPQRE